MVSVSKGGDLSPTIIAPEGEIDLERIDDFRAELARARSQAHGIIVDLTRVGFIDSSGLGALIDLYNRTKRDDRRLAVVVPEGTAVAVLLNLSGLQTRMPIYRTRETALTAISGGGSKLADDRHWSA